MSVMTAVRPITKVCTKCGESKALDAFGPRKCARDGRQSHCLACNAARGRERRWKRTGIPEADFPRKHRDHHYAESIRALTADMGLKRCGPCGKLKPFTAFSANAAKAEGRNSRCRECAGKYGARYYAENADKERERTTRYYAENADKERERSAVYRRSPAGRASHTSASQRYRARLRGLPDDGSGVADWLDHHEETDTWNCHLCGGAFRPGDVIQWDHRDPVSTGTAGTVVANMSAAHEVCNLSRGNVPLDEWHARLELPEGIV